MPTDCPSIKNDVLATTREILAQIPFNTIFSYADTLFDLKEVPFEELFLEKQVNFLKKAKLSDLEFLNVERDDFFTLRNRSTGESIEVSNRKPTQGEFRAQNLRHSVQKQKEKTPDEFAYDTITRAIRTPQSSDLVGGLKNMYSQGDWARETYAVPMSADHFDLFVRVVLNKIEEKIRNGMLDSHLEPKKIRDDKKLQDKILEGIDLDAIYESTQMLPGCLQAIKDKNVELERRGYYKAAQLASKLYDDLTSEKLHLIQGELSLQKFGENCSLLIQNAEKSELKNHRSFLGMIWSAIKIAINFIAPGAVTEASTESIERIREVKVMMEKIVEKRPSETDEEETESSFSFN